MQAIDYLAILQFGILGSLGHCIGMCGGFILSYTSTKIDASSPKISQAMYHLLYNSGRISSYVILGALFGAFGSLWEATPLMRAILFAFAGLMMILMGFSLAGKLKFLNNIEYGLTENRWYKKLFTKLITAPNRRSFYFLGMLNGFFPCGLVYAALVWAMATGSILGGALVMLIFGLSTLPTLFNFGFFVGLLKQITFRNIMVQLAALTIILYGSWTLAKSYMNFKKHLNPPKIEKMSAKTHSCH